MIKIAFKFIKFDTAKSIGIIVGIVISIFLIGQQMGTLFFLTNLMGGLEIHSNSEENDIWLIDELARNFNALNTIDSRLTQEVRSIEGVETSFPLLIVQSPATFKDGKTASMLLVGSEAPFFIGGPKPSIISGGNVSDLSIRSAISVEFFNVKTWRTTLKLNDQLEVNKKTATVKVTTKNAQGYGGNFVYTSLQNARFFSNIPNDRITVVVVRPKKGEDVQKVIDRINSTFKGVIAWKSGAIRDITINDILVKTNTGTSFGSLVIFAIVSGFFIIGLTMYSSVLDRIQDYGTLKAIGATNSYLTKLILMQAFLYGIAGFAIAYLLLLLFKQGVKSSGLILHFDTVFTLALFAVTLMMSVGGSLIAVYKIRKLEPASVF